MALGIIEAPTVPNEVELGPVVPDGTRWLDPVGVERV